MILGNLEVLAEALTFAEKSGIGGHHVEHLIKGKPILSTLSICYVY